MNTEYQDFYIGEQVWLHFKSKDSCSISIPAHIDEVKKSGEVLISYMDMMEIKQKIIVPSQFGELITHIE